MNLNLVLISGYTLVTFLLEVCFMYKYIVVLPVLIQF
jgi:hypothetical protein